MMKIITTNKRAYFDYEITDTVEAGLVLRGDEVKSIRNKGVSINDAFATVQRGSIQLLNCYIAPYSHAYDKTDTTRQTRQLLLHKKEVNKLIGILAKKGLTLIPLKLYFNDRGYVKIEIGLAKSKKLYDKKESIKERDIKRETAQIAKVRF
ncbi:MAG: SsrA-binding protein SmpB [Candidatus Babeliales bacterium]